MIADRANQSPVPCPMSATVCPTQRWWMNKRPATKPLEGVVVLQERELIGLCLLAVMLGVLVGLSLGLP